MQKENPVKEEESGVCPSLVLTSWELFRDSSSRWNLSGIQEKEVLIPYVKYGATIISVFSFSWLLIQIFQKFVSFLLFSSLGSLIILNYS